MSDEKREPLTSPAQSETPGMLENSIREKRETPPASGSNAPDRVERVSQGLGGAREAARRDRSTALLHHVTTGLLRGSYDSLRRAAAPGVDGVTWQQWEGLEARLQGTTVEENIYTQSR